MANSQNHPHDSHHTPDQADQRAERASIQNTRRKPAPISGVCAALIGRAIWDAMKWGAEHLLQ